MEKTVVNAFGGDNDDDKGKKGGGIFSLFGGDKDDDKDKDDGGLFSFGRDDKKKDKKDDDDDGFFSRLLNRDDDDDKQKKSGFKGLFNEQQGAAGSFGGQEGEGCQAGGATISGGGVSEGGEEALTQPVRLLPAHCPLLDSGGGKHTKHAKVVELLLSLCCVSDLLSDLMDVAEEHSQRQ